MSFLYTKPLQQISFDDILQFCQEQEPEGVELDYKIDIPTHLDKTIAAFANTRGGFIIIGVGENRDTGKPQSWEGISSPGRSVERIHQIIGNIEPFPSCYVHTTNDNAGKVFVIIRVMEGEQTPYYVHNDSSIYYRTGTVAKLIELASPDYQELLFGKRQKAEKARNAITERASTVYAFALSRAERERLRLTHISEENRKRGMDVSRIEAIYKGQLGITAGECTITITPYNPVKPLIAPFDLKINLEGDLRSTNRNERFPDLTIATIEAAPESVFAFYWGHRNGYIKHYQIYTQGLVYTRSDLVDTNQDGSSEFWIARLVSELYLALEFARNYYKRSNYQGLIKGNIGIDKMSDDIIIHPISVGGPRFPGLNSKSFLPTYYWEVDTNTAVLDDPQRFQEYLLKLIKEFHWDFGYTTVNDTTLISFLRQEGMLKYEPVNA